MVLVPGSPADSKAYAVERHDDGSVTLTLRDLLMEPNAQRELTERLRANGIHVDIQTLDMVHKCKQPRGEAVEGNFAVRPSTTAKAKQSKPPQNPNKPASELAPLATRMGTWKITLHRGDTLAFENNLSEPSKVAGGQVRGVVFYAVKGAIKPCVPVERPNPFWKG